MPALIAACALSAPPVTGCAAFDPDATRVVRGMETHRETQEWPALEPDQMHGAFEVVLQELARVHSSCTTEPRPRGFSPNRRAYLDAGFFVAGTGANGLLDQDLVLLRLLQHALTAEEIRSHREIYGGCDAKRVAVFVVQEGMCLERALLLEGLGITPRDPTLYARGWCAHDGVDGSLGGPALIVSVAETHTEGDSPWGNTRSLWVVLSTPVEASGVGGFGSTTLQYSVTPAEGGHVVRYAGAQSA